MSPSCLSTSRRSSGRRYVLALILLGHLFAGIGALQAASTIRLSSDTLLKRLLACKLPSYPDMNVSGGSRPYLAATSLLVGNDGRVISMSFDNQRKGPFEEATARALRHWRFRPVSVDGALYTVSGKVFVYFTHGSPNERRVSVAGLPEDAPCN
jgi:hypothetical protein